MLDETKETEVMETETEETKESPEQEKFNSSMRDLIDKQYPKAEPPVKEDAEEETTEETTETEKTEESKEEFVEVDEDFYSRGKAIGLSDDEIVDLFEQAPATLKVLERLYVKPEKKEEVKTPEVKEEEGLKLLQLSEEDIKKIESSEHSDLIKTLIQQNNELTKHVNAINGSFKETQENEEKRFWIGEMTAAQKKMDEWSESLPALGKYTELPKGRDGKHVVNDSRFKERSKIWDKAVLFYTSGSVNNMSEALDDAKAWYLGKNPELAELAVGKKLKKRATKFTARGSKKEMKKIEPKDFGEKMISKITEVLKK